MSTTQVRQAHSTPPPMRRSKATEALGAAQCQWDKGGLSPKINFIYYNCAFIFGN